MIAWVAFAAIIATSADVTLTPVADLWVYPHATDPERDPFLRVWGSGGKAVAEKGESTQSHSYAYLKFDLASTPKDAKLTAARLILTHTPDPTWTAEELKASPLEARLIASDFEEKDWNYANTIEKIVPPAGKSDVLGTATAATRREGKDFVVTIDLMQGPAKLSAAWSSARSRGALGLALTSAIDPEALGMKSIFKFYSKDGQKELRPSLVLEFESAAAVVRTRE
ncbi:MAG TPA: DNRLRE domain-containing protein [Fimbriimonadaceae bacterium]|nr:DNRLRE domain-containing protein [Fimbriimonadaceae bacterium]